MTYLYLPGKSELNENELKAFEKAFQEAGLDLVSHRWGHWSGEELEIEEEVKNILNKVGDKSTISLVAKSMGTYVGTYLLEHLKITDVYLMGVPVNSYSNKQLERYSTYSECASMTVLQRENDPLGSYQTVKEFVESLGINAELVSVEGDTHRYEVPEVVLDVIQGR